jgi:hypothetical protein
LLVSKRRKGGSLSREAFLNTLGINGLIGCCCCGGRSAGYLTKRGHGGIGWLDDLRLRRCLALFVINFRNDNRGC